MSGPRDRLDPPERPAKSEARRPAQPPDGRAATALLRLLLVVFLAAVCGFYVGGLGRQLVLGEASGQLRAALSVLLPLGLLLPAPVLLVVLNRLRRVDARVPWTWLLALYPVYAVPYLLFLTQRIASSGP